MMITTLQVAYFWTTGMEILPLIVQIITNGKYFIPLKFATLRQFYISVASSTSVLDEVMEETFILKMHPIVLEYHQ